MFKKIILISLFTFLLIGVFDYCNAQSEMEKQLQAAAGEKGAGFEKPVDPWNMVFLVIRYALSFLGFVFVLLTIYAGALWMFSGGEENKIETAKSILTASVIGVLIILLSYSITFFVFKLFLLDGATFRMRK